MVSSKVNASNITFLSLKVAYVAGGQKDALDDLSLKDNKTDTPISLSFFRNAGFSNSGASNISSGTSPISISNFSGNTFGSSGGGGKK